MKTDDKQFGFEEWVEYVFDRPVTDPEWYWEERYENDWVERSKETALGYLTRLFERPDDLMVRFSREQVGQGLWYLSSTACSDYGDILMNEEIPEGVRERCIRSTGMIFERLFAVHCSAELGHLLKKGDASDPLNMACYMWWHHFRELHGSDFYCGLFIGVIERILRLPSEACVESALHGLGHYEKYKPGDVHRIIDGFLESRPGISGELRAYALAARLGRVQ